jgi:hypothetical protein
VVSNNCNKIGRNRLRAALGLGSISVVTQRPGRRVECWPVGNEAHLSCGNKAETQDSSRMAGPRGHLCTNMNLKLLPLKEKQQ